MMMSSAESSTTSPTWQQATVNHYTTMAKLKQWMGVIAADRIQAESERQQKSIQAEDEAVRRGVWGDQSGSSSEDDMRQTVLGDLTINQQSPVPVASSGSWFKTLAGIGLAAAGIGTPAAIALPTIIDIMTPPAALQQVAEPQEPPPAIEFNDTDTKYDLELAD